jgi:cell division protein FtsZ
MNPSEESSISNNESTNSNDNIILLVGVGGGGSNAVNYMYKRSISNVDFAVVNTDLQALNHSPIPHKVQIGPNLTHGLGAGANPDMGRKAAVESKEIIRQLLKPQIKMLFITAGMGGGTGTGAAAVIASEAQKKGILTVGIVTYPFSFEGRKKQEKAEKGIKELRKYCDTVLVIVNDRLQENLSSLTISNAFAQADEVLTAAAKCIAEIITKHGYVNVDFQDICTVIRGAGVAVMGTGLAEGESRGITAATKALQSPLLDNRDIHGATKILLSIVSAPETELKMDELGLITSFVQEQVSEDAEVIFGHGHDEALDENIRITIIATGFKDNTSTSLPETYNRPASSASSFRMPYHSSSFNSSSHGPAPQHQQELQREQQSLVNSIKEGEKYHLAETEIRQKHTIPAYVRKNIALDYLPPQHRPPLHHYLQMPQA